jgi:hypothetical protein
MKKLFLILAVTITSTLIYGQKSIDALFERYAGRDGFTTVTINGNLLKLAASLSDDDEINSIPAEITEIRILAQEDNDVKVDNFYDLIIKGIDTNNYDEFMRVKESDQDLRMLVRSEGNRIKEFLLIAGGDNNAVIQIKGNMTYHEARKFCDQAKKDHGRNFISNRR